MDNSVLFSSQSSEEQRVNRRQEELRLILAEARLEHEAERLFEAARSQSDALVQVRVSRSVGTMVALTVAALLAVFGVGTWLMYDVDAQIARSRAIVAAQAEADRVALLTRQELGRQRFEGELARTRERLRATAEVRGRNRAR